MRRSSNQASRARLTMLLAALAGACSGHDSLLAPKPNTGSGQFWALTLNYHALTLSTAAPYDTLRLVATPSDANGNAVQGLAAPVFASNDVKDVRVDSAGVVHALGSASLVVVTATVSNGAYSLADTAYVSVTSDTNPSPLASLSIHPVPPDSAETSWDRIRPLPLTMLDAAGDTLFGLPVYYQSLNPTTATIDPTAGVVAAVYPGKVTFTASATVYGVTRADTVQYVIGWPLQVEINVTSALQGSRLVEGFSPRVVRMSPGAVVVWTNFNTGPIDVVFDDPASADSAATFSFCGLQVAPWICGSGNIDPFWTDTTRLGWYIRARAFWQVGRHPYHSSQYGTTGEIDIVDWHTIQ